jgi:hypothetical protein
MAFGTNPVDFFSPFDTGKVIGTGSQARAKELANSYLDTARVGGAGLDTIGKMRYNEIIGDAKRSAQSITNSAQSAANKASFISGGLDLLGNVGSFGAAGGFGNFGGGTDTLGVSDLQSFGRSAADIKTLESGGFIDHGYIG